MSDSTTSTHKSECQWLLENLLEVGETLYYCRDQQQLLEAILHQARAMSHAQAGSIYLAENDRLRFVAVQNDSLNSYHISTYLLGKEIAVSTDSLAGYVCLTGESINIPDCTNLAADIPYHLDTSFDSKTGYKVQSILAIPLNCPNGQCIGVLQLFNCQNEDGSPTAFPTEVNRGLLCIASSAAIAVHNMSLQMSLRQIHLDTIYRLSTLAEYRDSDTCNHIHRVSKTSEILARALGLREEQIQLITYASPMHDVGKVAIPDAILLKPGYLTPREREIMQRHTTVGAEIFNNAKDEILQAAQEVALCHHERWDGQGYPNRLKGKEIPISGRIVAVADVFDAVVSRRCYKEACPLDVALDILRKDSGNHFDPEVVNAFFEALDDILKSYPHLIPYSIKAS